MSDLYTVLTLEHLTAKRQVRCPVLVKAYEQTTDPSFASTSVYGRMDPIFTYQNTVRTFQVTCQTPTSENIKEVTDAHDGGAMEEIVDNEGRIIRRPASYASNITKILSTIYQFMYPTYRKETHGPNLSTRILTGPPLLRIKIPRVVSQLGVTTNTAGILFVPETFTVNSGLPNSNQIQFTVTGPDSLRYLAPAGGYGFTLGGTILHEGEPPGFIETGKNTGIYTFTKDNFPLGAEPLYTHPDDLKE